MEGNDDAAGLDRKPPQVLYHYCSTETFSAIIKSMTLRFSELSVSNDAIEGRMAMEALVRSCRQKQMPAEVIELLRRKKEFEDHWLVSSLGLCLSEEGDLLSQWRGYADDGYGFSIGFSTEFLTSIGKPISVAYTDDDHSKLVKPIADIMENLWSPELGQTLDLPPEEAGIYYQAKQQKQVSATGTEISISSEIEEDHFEFYNMLFEISLISYRLKGLTFAEEKEWRLLSPTESMDCHGSARNRITPYAAHKLTHESFSHIIIGPNNRTPPAVIRSLFAPGPTPIVTRSEATYRSSS